MKKNKVIIFITTVISVTLIIFGCIGYLIKSYLNVLELNEKVYPNVTVNNIEIGEMDYDEAKVILEETFLPKLEEMSINIKAGERYLSYPFSDIKGSYNIEEVLNEAIDYGKEEMILKRIILSKGKVNKSFKLKLSYDKEMLQNLEERIKADSYIAPVDAIITKVDSGFVVTDDIIGSEADAVDINNKLMDYFTTINNEDLIIEMKEKKALKTTDSLKRISGVMGSFQTSYNGSSYVRSKNIEIVTNNINGTVLMPGEEFSYGRFAKMGIGQYGNAPGYVNGQIVDVEGGGICQPCTTLYRAVMRSNIRSTERSPHMFTVGYATPGLDATVGGWGVVDYKFINTYDFPIYIEGYINNSQVHFNIYGDPVAKNGNTYDIVSNVYGLTAKSYQVTYDSGGNEIGREFIAQDAYKSH